MRAGMAFYEGWAKIIISIILKKLKDALTDLLPIIIVIAFFQIVVLRQPLPHMEDVLFGTVLVVIGLGLFVQGLEMGLFPIGETLAHALARKGSLFWLLSFAFALGFSKRFVTVIFKNNNGKGYHGTREHINNPGKRRDAEKNCLH